MIIREIQRFDNQEIAKVIREVLVEHDVPKVGTAYADVSLDSMFETYSKEKSIYFVVEDSGKIIGGAGISPLENSDENICELQKMYFLPEARAKGVGAMMMQKCLEKAVEFGFEKCYLETMPNMEKAQTLYRKFEFEYLCSPKGNTGHGACPVWMLKDLI